MASDTYHESLELLSEATKDMHRAIRSLMEELDAVDWYQQRADVTGDADLRAILLHNKNEEIEHAMMVLEWIRRRDAVFDVNARRYLFRAGDIVRIEGAEDEASSDDEAASAESGGVRSLGIGSLRGS